ncbi:MAG: hypothetical protein II601_04985 [Lachnospiraceae bacterium]|nr:hypothetical protein [Lachnospiraceae bacterium]
MKGIHGIGRKQRRLLFEEKREAQSREVRLKQLSHKEKEALIRAFTGDLKEFGADQS